MFPRNFFIIVLVFYSFALNAQYVHDIVRLQNGDVARGKIEMVDSNGARVQNLKGEVRFYANKEIDRVERNIFYRYAGYTSAGMLIGAGASDKETILSVLSEHTFLLSRHLAVGALTGVELINEPVIPLGLNARFLLPLKTRTVFLSLSGGKSYSLDKPENLQFFENVKTKGGSFRGVEIGVSIPLNYRNGLFFAMGYRNQALGYSFDSWGMGRVNREHVYDRLTMRMGFVLN